MRGTIDRVFDRVCEGVGGEGGGGGNGESTAVARFSRGSSPHARAPRAPHRPHKVPPPRSPRYRGLQSAPPPRRAGACPAAAAPTGFLQSGPTRDGRVRRGDRDSRAPCLLAGASRAGQISWPIRLPVTRTLSRHGDRTSNRSRVNRVTHFSSYKSSARMCSKCGPAGKRKWKQKFLAWNRILNVVPFHTTCC